MGERICPVTNQVCYGCHASFCLAEEQINKMNKIELPPIGKRPDTGDSETKDKKNK